MVKHSTGIVGVWHGCSGGVAGVQWGCDMGGMGIVWACAACTHGAVKNSTIKESVFACGKLLQSEIPLFILIDVYQLGLLFTGTSLNRERYTEYN